MQSVQIPAQPVLASIGYKNVGNIEMMLYKLSPEDFTDQDPNLKGKPLRTWQQALPNSDDLKAHRAEIKIDALPLGQYVLIVRNPGSSMDTLYHYFQVSNLSIVKGPNEYRSGTTSKVYILDREKGTPVANATLQYKKGKWISLATSGKDGLLNHTISNRVVDYNTEIELVLGQDRLILKNEAGSLMEYERNYTEDKKDRYQDFLFTDRSIYRPGQTVYFKGISLKSSYDSKVNNIVPDKSVTVTFKDANGQLIKELSLTTNSFGSFSGSFTAPESGLTGNMYIQTGEGSVYFNVEEYKRPRFQVSFDTVKNNYALNDQVSIKGKAMAYAGNSISNAQVQYRVVRRTRFPYFWRASRWGFPMSSGQQEMTNGTTETDAAGNFSINFKAIPDASVPADAEPVFQYEITADITDVNGETRSSTSYFSAGYTGIILEANIPEQSTPEQLSKLSIRTENLNGVFTPAPVTVKVSLLKSPDHFYRERLWEAPTDFVLKESEFRAAFPNDMYGEEWKPENRAVADVVWEHQYTTEEGNTLQTKNDIWMSLMLYGNINILQKRAIPCKRKMTSGNKLATTW
ncbi:MG2 domain protein [compost metagenome]